MVTWLKYLAIPNRTNGLVAGCALSLVWTPMWNTMCNRQPRLSKHRLRYFEAVASSTARFAAEHRPSYRKHLVKYDVQFWKLVRCIVGPPPGTAWSAQWQDILYELNIRVDHWSHASGTPSWSKKCMTQSWIFSFPFLTLQIYLPNAGWGGRLHGNHVQHILRVDARNTFRTRN